MSGADTQSLFSPLIEIADNILVGKQNVVVHDGNKIGISIHDNVAAGTMDDASGPGCLFREQ